jgi:RNA polymerase sigma-70 factor (ECF subfamily)
MPMGSAIENEFLQLIEVNRPRILRISQAYARTPQDAEDLYQDILFQIWRGLPALKQKAHANTWLYRVAINSGISFVRKTKSGGKAVAVENDQLLQHPARAHEQDNKLDTLRKAMAKLNKIEKGVVMLFLDECSYEQIAEVMGMNANQVGVLLHRTKRKLFELMQEDL